MNSMAVALDGVCKSYRFFELRNVGLRVPRGTIM